MQDGPAIRTPVPEGSLVVIAKVHRFDEFTESEIQALVDSLESLNEGELGVSMLVACGPRAVPVLRKSLLQGRPRVVYQPRQRAVRALTELGAKDVLLEYLAIPKNDLPPDIRYAEEAVESTAARSVTRWHTDDVFEILLALVSRRAVAGAIETLGEFRRVESLPILIRLLGDDVARPFAADAIGKLGKMAASELVEAAITPDPSRTHEAPSSLVRRRQALRLLMESGSLPDSISRVKALICDPDPEISANAAQMIVLGGNEYERNVAIERLLDVYKHTNWFLQTEIQRTLMSVSDAVLPILERRLGPAHDLNYADAMLFRALTSSKSKLP